MRICYVLGGISESVLAPAAILGAVSVSSLVCLGGDAAASRANHPINSAHWRVRLPRRRDGIRGQDPCPNGLSSTDLFQAGSAESVILFQGGVATL
mgnify:CR=1 FL=1